MLLAVVWARHGVYVIATAYKGKTIMKITLDLTDSAQLAEILDAIVGAHLKSSRRQIVDWHSTHPDDVEYDTKVIGALDTVIAYFTGDDDADQA